ncbi:maleate cis-trans isomerase family protein [Streptomyces sp. SPB074]|uniref:maleate cis-trans isomerase family protein n=1 Tax=Streptomyces sp. (strain SPB074) TaxID=465543 RepID=UPI00017F1D06|nr:decarboxylase [Streptomyces sp. SPB074]EDY44470.1 decarboxylase [Streptomyces sp. SPB074]
MTALGFLYPGHAAEDDYPRIEQTLASDIRLALAHVPASGGEAGWPGDALAGKAAEDLRLSGAEAVVWASTLGSAAGGPEESLRQADRLAKDAGAPASGTATAFVNAARELGMKRVSLATPYDGTRTETLAAYLRAAGFEVAGAVAGGPASPAEAAAWDAEAQAELVREAAEPGPDGVLLACTALRTAAYLPRLELAAGRPVLTANQVSVWEALRLAERRVREPALGTLFTVQPPVLG